MPILLAACKLFPVTFSFNLVSQESRLLTTILMARRCISPRLPKGLLGFSCRVWYNLSCQLIVVGLDKKPSRCIYLQKRALQMTITLQLILFASKYTSRLYTACYNNIVYSWMGFVQISGRYYLRLMQERLPHSL